MIKLDGLQQKANTFKLMDINGKVIEMQNLSGNNQVVLQNKLNPGIYILTVSDGQKINLTKKLMVAH